MKRFTVEVLPGLLAALFIGIAASYIAERIGHKANAKANADIRSSFALERIAAALERECR